ncbi:hypothetical protein NDU88_013191 [Pleurodeles waltl]|uniref:Uncharacterized protein n=1 Tax=Pleurodeles waltl TaxID=8319 RepID=A0AAV7R2D0_PLEWA|nr:hypothetical protein NDU88_013191 [Pleurodeles waltl]
MARGLGSGEGVTQMQLQAQDTSHEVTFLRRDVESLLRWTAALEVQVEDAEEHSRKKNVCLVGLPKRMEGECLELYL